VSCGDLSGLATTAHQQSIQAEIDISEPSS
jgi:hypothetical protein